MAAFKTFKAVTGPVSSVVSVITKLTGAAKGAGLATTALNAIMAANPATLIAGAIALLVGGLATYALTAGRADEQQDVFNKKMDELGASIEKTQNDLDSLKDSMSNTSSSIEASGAPIEKWRGKLEEAFDETGHVKEGCEDMANYILGQLNDAMGTNYHVTSEGFIADNDEVQQSLKDVNNTIDEYVRNLKLKSLQEAIERAGQEEIFIAGGAEIFQEALPLADKIYMTYVDMEVPDADRFFPDFPEEEYKREEIEKVGGETSYLRVLYTKKV